jgi:hypothetical protein
MIVLCVGSLVDSGKAQLLNARRLGMGGVVTSDNSHLASANIALRAVRQGQVTGTIPLPFGLVQLAASFPTFDPEDPEFNIFELADLAINPPLNYSVRSPGAISSDVSIFLARDAFRIDLNSVGRVVPRESISSGSVYHLPGIGERFGVVYPHVYPMVHVRSAIDLGDDLRAALRNAVPIKTNTRYSLTGDARGQAAVALQVDVAFCAWRSRGLTAQREESDPRRDGTTALYVGIGPKYLLGLALGDARVECGVTTRDTLFGDDPVDFDITARDRFAVVGGDGGIGSGLGSDIGAVFYWRNFELGIGLNDVGSRIHWKTTVERHEYDDVTDEFVSEKVAMDATFTSRIPITTMVNVAKRIGTTTLAADLVKTDSCTIMHIGAERWYGGWAIRAGGYRDRNKLWQIASGVGFRFGKLGLDVALGTHSRNIVGEQETELAISLSRY